MAKKNNRKPENGSAAPSFRTDSKLGKAFLSILEQNTAPEENPSDKEDDGLSAPIDLLPGDETKVPGVSGPANLSKTEETSDKTAETAESVGKSEVDHELKDFIDGLDLDDIPAGTTAEKSAPETKTVPDATETEKRPKAEKAPVSVPQAVQPEAREEEPRQVSKAFRAPDFRKKGRRTLPVHEKALSEKDAEKALPDEKPVPKPENASDPLLVFKTEIGSESKKASGREIVFDPEFEPEEPEQIPESDFILDPEALFASDPEPEPAPEAETVVGPETVPGPDSEAVKAPEIVPGSEILSTDEVPKSEAEENIAFSAPFLRNPENFSSLALDFLIAALPLLGARIWYFGWRTVTVLLTALAVCLFSELVFALIARKDPPSALKDRNFAVTALTITIISSPNLPLWSVAVLSALAVILFRGILGLRTSTVRSHPLNPAMAAFSLLLLFWHGLDRFGAAPGVRAPLLLASPDPAAYGVGNPVLSSLREGVLPTVSPVSFIFGNAAGLLPMLFVLFALVYLLVRKTVPWQIPAAMIFSGILFAALLPRTVIRTDMLLLQSVLFEICSGTFLLCALFCGADTATVPYTGTGKLVFGFLAGAFTILLRHYTGIINCAPIGVIAANALTPLINRFTVPRPFGGK